MPLLYMLAGVIHSCQLHALCHSTVSFFIWLHCKVFCWCVLSCEDKEEQG